MNGIRPENKELLIFTTFCYAGSPLCATEAETNQVKTKNPKNLVNPALPREIHDHDSEARFILSGASFFQDQNKTKKNP